jgi:hypothetical protein
MAMPAAHARFSASMVSKPGRPFLIALTTFRAALAASMVLATFAQLANYEVYWRRIGLHDLGLRTGNFFSAFTFEVNLIGAVILVTGAWLLWRDHGAERLWFTRIRLCLLAAIVVVGVVYNLLLRGAPTGPGEQVDWANNVVHVVAPLGITIDWLVTPHAPRIPLSNVALVPIYPVAWLIYSFVRALLVPDELARTPYVYPYGFLNPHGPGGWPSVITMIGILILLILAIGAAAILAIRVEDGVSHRTRTRTRTL